MLVLFFFLNKDLGQLKLRVTPTKLSVYLFHELIILTPILTPALINNIKKKKKGGGGGGKVVSKTFFSFFIKKMYLDLFEYITIFSGVYNFSFHMHQVIKESVLIKVTLRYW